MIFDSWPTSLIEDKSKISFGINTVLSYLMCLASTQVADVSNRLNLIMKIRTISTIPVTVSLRASQYLLHPLQESQFLRHWTAHQPPHPHILLLLLLLTSFPSSRSGGGACEAEQDTDGGVHSRVGGQQDARLLPQSPCRVGHRLPGRSTHQCPQPNGQYLPSNYQ